MGDEMIEARKLIWNAPHLTMKTFEETFGYFKSINFDPIGVTSKGNSTLLYRYNFALQMFTLGNSDGTNLQSICPYNGCQEFCGNGTNCQHYQKEMSVKRSFQSTGHDTLFHDTGIDFAGIAKVFQVIAKARDIGDWTSPKDHEKMIYSVGKTHYFDPSLNLMVYQKEPHSLSLAIVNTESVGLGPFFSCGIPGCCRPAIFPQHGSMYCIRDCPSPSAQAVRLGTMDRNAAYLKMLTSLGYKNVNVAELGNRSYWIEVLKCVYRKGLNGYRFRDSKREMTLFLSPMGQFRVKTEFGSVATRYRCVASPYCNNFAKETKAAPTCEDPDAFICVQCHAKGRTNPVTSFKASVVYGSSEDQCVLYNWYGSGSAVVHVARPEKKLPARATETGESPNVKKRQPSKKKPKNPKCESNQSPIDDKNKKRRLVQVTFNAKQQEKKPRL